MSTPGASSAAPASPLPQGPASGAAGSSERRLDEVLRAAIAEGVLPAGARRPVLDHRPWPVVLLTALGGWLAALPLIALAGLLLLDAMRQSAASYVVGALVLGAAIVLLRRRDLPLFAEQFTVPALLVGAAALGFGLYRDLSTQAAATVLALIALASAAAIPRAWLRVLLGAAAAVLSALTWIPDSDHWWRDDIARFWLAWHANLLLWLAAGGVQRRLLDDGLRARAAAGLESVRAGWLLATLAGLAWWSGMTFLVGATLSGGLLGEVMRDAGTPTSAGPALQVLRAASALLALAAAAVAARRWPGLRSLPSAGVALVLVALAGFMPALGAVLLALAVCATGKRWLLAASAAVTAAWIVGGFYYQLAWPLAAKALLLVGAGAVLGALAWLALGPRGRALAPTPLGVPLDPPGASTANMARLGIAATALAVFAVANLGIWQKEDLIAHGQPVFVEMAPSDPRSLMQGDFMTLNFRMPADVQSSLDGLLSERRPKVVGRRDARGVATLLRLDDGKPLAADEMRIELTPQAGSWVLVSNGWSFKEGEAARWSAAKYGEFRVDPNGRALLVGLRGTDLEKL